MTAKKRKAGRDDESSKPETVAHEVQASGQLQDLRKETEQNVQYEKILWHATSQTETTAKNSELRAHQAELQKRNNKLSEKENQLQLVLESGNIGTWIWDVQDRRIEWNEQLYEMVGLPPNIKEITPETFFHYVHPKDMPRVQENLAAVLKSGSDFKDTFRIVRENGEIRWLSGRGRVFRDTQGTSVRMVGVNYDITDCQQIAETLRLERQKLKNILDSIPDAVYIVNQQGNIEYVNPEMEKHLGAWAGKKCYEYREGRDEPCPSCKFDQIQGGKTIREEWTDEKLGRIYDCIDTPLANPDGSVSKLKIMRDVTEAKRTQEELELHVAQLQTTLDSLTEGLVISDLDGNLFHWNPAAVAMHGFSSMEEFRRKLPELNDIFELSTEGDGILPVERWPLARILRGETLSNWEVHLRRLGSDWHRILSYGGALACNKDGEALLAVVSVTDITEHKQAENALRLHEARLQVLLELNKMEMASQAEILDFVREEGIKITQSEFAFIGFMDEDESIMKIDSWSNGAMKHCAVVDLPMHFPIAEAGLWGEVVRQRRPIVVNDFMAHRHRRSYPEGHVPIKRFLSVPVFDTNRIVAVAAVANKQEDYEEADIRALTSMMNDMWRIIQHKRIQEQVGNLAKFPSENPSPVLRIASHGVILYSNGPGLSLLEAWNTPVGQQAPRDWCEHVSRVLDSGQNIVKDVEWGERIISLATAPVVEGGYVNIYGRDITKEREAEKALRKAHAGLEKKVEQRTTELAETVEILRREVEHRIQAEQFVRERSRVLDAFFSHAIMPLAILDNDFNFIRVNKAYADACERDTSQFPGHNHFEFFPHEENQRIFEGVVKTKIPYEAVAKPFSFPDHPEWGITYWDWTLVPVLDEAGEVELLVFSLEDVTAHRQSELAMEESEARYRALVELSPDPVVVIADDTFAFANAAGIELVGLSSPDELVGRQIWDFVHPDSRRAAATLLRAALRGKKRIALTELKALRSDGQTVEVEVSVALIQYKGEVAVQAVVRDITERKRAEDHANLTKVLLELFAQKTSVKEYLDSVVGVVQSWSGCRCVGIRLINADDCIPYESYVGFSEEFLLAENMLRLRKDVCVCIRVVTEKCESQEIHTTTERGSFRCDNIFKFVESLTEAERDRYRGKCAEHGFKSVAIIPFRYGEKILGAIHLADEHENMVPLENVQFLEDMAALIGEAVHRFAVEQALRLSESRLVEAQRIAHIGNWDWDILKNTLWWSDEVYHIFGLKPEHFKATNEAFLACVHPNDRGPVKTAVDEAISSDKTYSMDHRIIRPDGTQRTVHERAEVIYDDQKNAIRMIGTVQDITEFKQAEEKILADQVALRSLTSELQLTEERERRRIANDLHDSVGQILAMSKRELIHLQKSPPADVAISLKEVVNQLDQAVRETRTLSFELSPSVLYDLGLEVALEDLVERFSNKSRISCRFQNSKELEPLPEAIGVLLYRSIRELLINAAKHSNAAEILVSLNKTEDNLHIVVEDDGCGFDVSILDSSSRRPKGFGVLSIKERLKHIGGYCDIKSDHGEGTKVTLVVPLDTKEIIERS